VLLAFRIGQLAAGVGDRIEKSKRPRRVWSTMALSLSEERCSRMLEDFNSSKVKTFHRSVFSKLTEAGSFAELETLHQRHRAQLCNDQWATLNTGRTHQRQEIEPFQASDRRPLPRASSLL
jgi:Starter unit:ACP transacylase in aflatoxin biosynthesis